MRPKTKLAKMTTLSPAGIELLNTLHRVGTTREHVRTQTLSLINRLSKWQKLPLLLRIADLQEGQPGITAHNFVRD